MTDAKCIVLIVDRAHSETLVQQLEQHGFRVVFFPDGVPATVDEVNGDLILFGPGVDLSGVTDFGKNGQMRPLVLWGVSEAGASLYDGLDPTCVACISGDTPIKDVVLRVKQHLVTCETIQSLRQELTKCKNQRLSYERQVQRAQKMESLGILAGGIAHDFNNLLVGVMGNADLARSDLDKHSSAYERISDVIKASRRAGDLARQMLAYSGQGRFDLIPICLDELVGEMMGLLEVAVSKRVKAFYKLNVGNAMCRGDATQIRQIIMNLITNASEAVSESGGSIHVETGLRECSQAFVESCSSVFDQTNTEMAPAGTYVYFQVKDHGHGMDESILAKIFDPFFTTKITGRGLGLAAVLGIVRGHHGFIKIDTKPNEGTLFQVLFPAVAVSPDDVVKAKIRRKDKWHGSGNILLADDEESVLDVTSCMLARMGFETLTATNGEQAIEMFRKHADQIACVILDVTMPFMNGVQAFHEIRSINKHAKVVLSSGFNKQDVSKGIDLAGLADFIQKPYETRSLRECLRKLLGD